MKTIRLIRQVDEPGTRGPTRGQWALQRAIIKADLPWLQVGGALRHAEIPWVWSYEDANIIDVYEQFGWPYIVGPNVLFMNSSKPCSFDYERAVCNGEHCALLWTESEWYAALIQANCDLNEAPIRIFHYPIDPTPEGPAEIRYDVLIYLKDRRLGREFFRARDWSKEKCALVVYGHYDRDEMLSFARQSRCCLYLSTDDRGPLAAAEIALSGCPLIGVERGCPWVCKDGLGVQVPHFSHEKLNEGMELASAVDRGSVRLAAMALFSPGAAMKTITSVLEPLAQTL